MMANFKNFKNGLRYLPTNSFTFNSSSKLLHQAQMNDKNVKTEGNRCYKSTFSAPKKSEKSRVSSDNIKKFLARKEEEERKKLLEAHKKKEELLAMRSLDKKAHKRVQTMLKRTKSANKSVMEDAVDNFNTNDTLGGPQQCDEDDYGYVSQEASALYEKLMAKYENAPVENLKGMTREVKDLKAAKDRVKAALDKEAEEQLHPIRKRKRKHEEDDSIVDDEIIYEKPNLSKHKTYNSEEPEKEKVKLKKIPKKMPPPVDFFELMKIAAKKQHEPIIIEKKKAEEPERPLTMKEKLERQKEMDRINKKNTPKSQVPSKPSKEKPSTSANDERSSKLQSKSNVKTSSDKLEQSKPKSIVKVKSDINSNCAPSQVNHKKEVKFNQTVNKSSPISSTPKSSSINGFKERSSNSIEPKSKSLSSGASRHGTVIPKNNVKVEREVEKPAPKVDVSDIDREIELLMKRKKMLMEEAKSQKPTPKPNSPSQSSKESFSGSRPSQDSKANKVALSQDSKANKVALSNKGSVSTVPKKPSLGMKNDTQMKVSSVEKSKMASRAIRPDQTPVSPGPQRKLPPHVPPRRLPPSFSDRKKKIHKRVIDSESEQDSEMDDFIDDGPNECMDYSRHIKEIFGYDKSRYSAIDEDECEEASFRTQMMEERRSAKIGLLEDLEDIQREKEEKARAKMRKKMKR